MQCVFAFGTEKNCECDGQVVENTHEAEEFTHFLTGNVESSKVFQRGVT